MDDGSTLFALFLFFVIAGGFFAGAESCFSAMNRIRIKTLADDGNKRAKSAQYIADHFDRALTALLIGTNVTHIAAASTATLFVMRKIEEHGGFWGFLTADNYDFATTVITTLIVFLFSEMIPKTFANDRADSMALACAGFLRGMMKILTPLTAFFTMISSFASRLVHKEEKPSITEEELYDIIDTAEEEGVVDEKQSDLIKSALDFSGTKAGDVMTARSEICAIDVALSNEEIIKIILSSTHSRIPVYEHDLDHIIGTLPIRIFIREYMKNHKVSVRASLIKPYFVKADACIDDILSFMQHNRFYLAIVQDAQGHTEGVVTIEDFLEELVGEIWDEDDVVDKNFVKLGGNRYLVSTRMTVGEAFSKMGLTCQDERLSTRPILSWLLEVFGCLPEEKQRFSYQNLEITIDRVAADRVTQVVFHKLDANASGYRKGAVVE